MAKPQRGADPVQERINPLDIAALGLLGVFMVSLTLGGYFIRPAFGWIGLALASLVTSLVLGRSE